MCSYSFWTLYTKCLPLLHDTPSTFISRKFFLYTQKIRQYLVNFSSIFYIETNFPRANYVPEIVMFLVVNFTTCTRRFIGFSNNREMKSLSICIEQTYAKFSARCKGMAQQNKRILIQN
jgi:hypothetical protein